jgi:hypothetical protein
MSFWDDEDYRPTWFLKLGIAVYAATLIGFFSLAIYCLVDFIKSIHF